jgi:hypothetical protein
VEPNWQTFRDRETGPIRLVVIQVSDLRYAHVLLPHQTIEAATRVLEAWDICPTTTKKVHRSVHKWVINDLELIK